MNEINRMTVKEMTDAYRTGRLSPVEVTKSVIDRANEVSQVNALVMIDEEAAIAAAKESETFWMRNTPRGLLEGVPISIKDSIDVKGMPTRCGSTTTSPDPVPGDCDAVACLREQGALLFAKTTTSEFTNKIVTECPLTGITRNAWNIERTSGGSSGGSAVSVALGINPASVGSDGGGSIRIPACWNGIVGYKPTGHLVPIKGSDHRELSHIGPLTRSVEDAAMILSIIANHHNRDWKAVPATGYDYCKDINNGISGLKVAFTMDHGMDIKVDEAIAASVRQAVGVMKDLGAEVFELEETPMKTYMENNLHSIQWIVYLDQTIRRVPEKQRRFIDPDCLDLASVMQYYPSTKFVDALARRYQYADEMHRFFDDYDILITPTFHAQAPGVPGLPKELCMAPPLTSWCNQTMQPACSVPCGFTSEYAGMPVGLQFISRRFNDALVLRAARAYEAARGPFPMPPEPGIPASNTASKRKKW